MVRECRILGIEDFTRDAGRYSTEAQYLPRFEGYTKEDKPAKSKRKNKTKLGDRKPKVKKVELGTEVEQTDL